MVILPIGWLYATYHLLREPGNFIEAVNGPYNLRTSTHVFNCTKTEIALIPIPDNNIPGSQTKTIKEIVYAGIVDEINPY